MNQSQSSYHQEIQKLPKRTPKAHKIKVERTKTNRVTYFVPSKARDFRQSASEALSRDDFTPAVWATPVCWFEPRYVPMYNHVIPWCAEQALAIGCKDETPHNIVMSPMLCYAFARPHMQYHYAIFLRTPSWCDISSVLTESNAPQKVTIALLEDSRKSISQSSY